MFRSLCYDSYATSDDTFAFVVVQQPSNKPFFIFDVSYLPIPIRIGFG
jgi:hypothetical protein